MSEIHYLPKDALVPVEIGAGFLFRLQQLLVYLIHDKSKDELEELRVRLEKNDLSNIPEDSWMYQYQTIQLLVSSVEQTALQKKITVTKASEN
jgi:hypothetical protein